MADDRMMLDCFLCKRAFQFGPHIHNGKRIPEWEMMVCDGCYKGNWDGIVPGTRPHLIPYLKSRGLEVKPNAKGWIDWPS
jgi:hypothetical protein